jgi:hypothetical protein
MALPESGARAPCALALLCDMSITTIAAWIVMPEKGVNSATRTDGIMVKGERIIGKRGVAAGIACAGELPHCFPSRWVFQATHTGTVLRQHYVALYGARRVWGISPTTGQVVAVL